jgi:histidine phosphotransferase ChpT
MQIDLRVLELMSSKLCHDLISPVSAINNGVELIEEIGGDVVAEAMTLIGNSARQSSRLLRLYRMAYGRAGADANITVKDVRQIVAQCLEGGKIDLRWPEDVPAEAFARHKGALKTLANLLMLAEETLAYGGVISLFPCQHENQVGCRIAITGRGVHLSELFRAALEGQTPIEELTPRTIQSYISGKFAEHYGLKITHAQPLPDQLDLIGTITVV